MMKNMLDIWLCASALGFIGALFAFVFYLFGAISFDIGFYIWSAATLLGGIIGRFGGTKLLQPVEGPNSGPSMGYEPVHKQR